MSILHRILDKDLHVLKINRPLNGRSAKELEQKFQEAFDCGAKRVIVDLEEVPFIDSSGLSALVIGYRLFGHDSHNFRLAAPQEQPKLLFELTMFNRIFQVFDTLTSAIETKAAIWPRLRQHAPAFASL
jgi:anti-sigma B factor antagonist